MGGVFVVSLTLYHIEAWSLELLSSVAFSVVFYIALSSGEEDDDDADNDEEDEFLWLFEDQLCDLFFVGSSNRTWRG